VRAARKVILYIYAEVYVSLLLLPDPSLLRLRPTSTGPDQNLSSLLPSSIPFLCPRPDADNVDSTNFLTEKLNDDGYVILRNAIPVSQVTPPHPVSPAARTLLPISAALQSLTMVYG